MTEPTAVLLKQASATVRALTQDRDQLATQLAILEKKSQAQKIASEMRDRGLIADTDVPEKVAELQERDNLEVVEEALNLSAPEELAKIASVGDSPSAAAGVSELESYVMSQAGQ